MSYITTKNGEVEVHFEDATGVRLFDTADADITAADVVKDKIAYGAEGRIVGTYEAPDLSLADATAEDIRRGKIAFGPDGVLTGVFEGVDTSDADATANDIVVGKTAYVNGEKLTGIFEGVDTSDADATAGDIREGKTAYVDGVKITGTGQMVESPDWFKVTNLDNSRNLVFYIKDASVSLSTSLDNGETWTGYTNIIGNWSWTVPAGGTILFDGKINNSWVGRFDGDISYKVSGNLNTLLIDDPGSIIFRELFYNDDQLIDVEDLVLPWRIIQDESYYHMFYGCRGLITPPRELPAYTVPNSAYSEMFRGCTSLTTAPRILAQHFGQSSAWYMFSDCTSLTTAPALPALELEYNCYSSMFARCTSLTTAPDLPATNIDSNAYDSMFSGCTSLTTPPIIGAETIIGGAQFASMFNGTNLNSMPVFNNLTIPDGYGNPDTFNYAFTGTKLTGTVTVPNMEIMPYYGGCRAMFMNTNISGLIIPSEYVGQGDTYANIASDCSNLSYVECHAKYKHKYYRNDPDVPMDSDDVGNFSDWLSNVAASGTLKVPASMASFYTDNNLVPAGWTLETF